MNINPKTTGIHHITIRCKDMEVSKTFYQTTLGLQIVYESPSLNAFMIGSVLLAIRKAETSSDKEVFNPMTIGLDHIAIACETENELHRVAKELTNAGIENTGVKLDNTLNKLYVAFKDPDRFQWEFYMI
jgi:catechol 2,3-dioxygenase-like lactoylglutathione lyase family enzyme